MLRKWDKQFVLPKWKYYIVLVYRHRKEILRGFLEVIGAILLAVFLYLLIVLSLLDWKEPDNKVNDNSSHNQTYNLSNQSENIPFTHKKIIGKEAGYVKF
ncbi:hypothetical protein [Persephonella sp.]